MNLIVDRRLDPAERQVIQALTLKKRQSKKSHMSEKQVLARQQLANELMQVRKPLIGYTRSQSQLPSVNEANTEDNKCRPDAKHLLMRQSKSSASLLRHHQFATSSSHQFLAASRDGAKTTSSCSCACNTSYTACTCACNMSTSSSHLYGAELENYQDHNQSNNKGGLAAASSSTIATNCDTATNFHANHHHHHRISSVGSSCSFSRSDSSYSGSSQDSGAHMHIIMEKQHSTAGATESHNSAEADITKGTDSELESTTMTTITTEGDVRVNESDEVDDKEVSIKFNKSRLERLNAELEKRLYQYEYLVAQEKALLGTYNLMLFTSEGVNNFAY